jgi:hypothetical protein
MKPKRRSRNEPAKPQCPRTPRVEVLGRTVAGAVGVSVIDRDIANMGLRVVLRWAANDDGRLLTRKLARIAEVRGYKPGWVYHNRGKHWEQVWDEMMARRRKERGYATP